MKHAVTRGLGIAVATLLPLLPAAAAAAPATAGGTDLGWLRVAPATGSTADVMSVLTEAPCPSEATGVVIKFTGPNIPRDDNAVGNLMGVTQLSAFKPTLSGQVLMPVSFTFRDWFAVNGITVKTGARYTVSATCRDLLKPKASFGEFIGQVAFDEQGKYRVLGEAAKPFDTELKPEDPFEASALPTPAPSSSAPSDGDPTPSSSAVPSGDAGDDVAGPSEPTLDAAAQVPPSDVEQSGFPGVIVLIGLALLAALGLVWNWIDRRRHVPVAGSHGARE